jgi:hypothetical protein
VYEKRNSFHTYGIFFLLMLLIAALACGGSTTDKLEEAAQPAATEVQEAANAGAAQTGAQEEQSSAASGETAASEPEEAAPTAVPEPTEIPPTPTPVPEPITVTKYGFGQDGIEVGYAFLVENPNPGLSFEDSQYQVAAFDANGTVIDTDSGYLTVLLPGQTLGVANSMYVDEGVTVASIDVQLNAGDAEATDPLPTFSVDSISYYPDEYFSSVTGLVTSPYNRAFEDVRVSAVLYNEAGDIIGGGFTYLDFILANDSAGVEFSVTSAGDVASYELYPSISGLSMLGSEPQIPSGAAEPNLLNYGFGQSESQAGIGLIVENPNDNYSLESSKYHVTAFAADGTVLGTEEGYITVLLPGQTLGVGADLYPKGDAAIDSVVVRIMAGKYVDAEPIATFTSDNAVYMADRYFPQVTGLILSPYSTDVTDLRVSAILFDGDGNIIGGGYTYLDFVPANGQAAVEVSVTSSGTPATSVLYATATSLSEFE